MYNCEIIRQYDGDGDGTISPTEAMKAMGDDITPGERDSVIAAWKLGVGGADQLCPGRVEDITKVFMPFAVAAIVAHAVMGIIWR